MFVLDTCVLSEIMRPRPDPAVDAWFEAQSAGLLHISALTVGEVWFGIDQLATGRQRRSLERWFSETIVEGFEGRILPFDFDAAFRWGGLRVEVPAAKIVDSQIAATTIVHGFTLVTRNVSDFAYNGLSVLNPWRT
ncbi:MAG TPA: type II toxin-antitoxin system VapC family toxin [Rhizomicrobium sp.]|jgi:predicted nucleic acid-binding protein|nr:type II toxin-antitoxin system VapC family toxin [Rhizomicrobium sp.]